MHRYVNNGLVLISNSDVFYQLYKTLLFFSEEILNLLFMFIDSSFNLTIFPTFLNSKIIFTIPKYISVIYDLNDYLLKVILF